MNERLRKVRTYAQVSTEFDFIHHWPEAEGFHSHLRNLHRHKMHVQVWVEQWHDDREVEYLDLRDRIKGFIVRQTAGEHWGNTWSCEMVARSIADWLETQYGEDRTYQVRVLEDGENGAVVQSSPFVR